jgi:multidrug efflux pump subunit AcrA (membrane-fusion protein)
LRKEVRNMKEWLKNLSVLSLLLVVIVAGGVCKADAAGFGHGHRPGADMKIIASLGLSSDEQTALTNALSTYGPAVKTAMQAFHAAKKQLKTDLDATPPVGSQLVADATALANAKTQLKAARTQLDSALSAALTPAHLQQLQAQLTAQFQSRLDKKTDRLLFGYAMHLKKQ